VSRDEPSAVFTIPGFALAEKIGEGGMGVVYRATDAEFGRPVAVKVMKADRPGPDAVRRFHDEARITGRLQHPGVPPRIAWAASPTGGRSWR